MNQRNSQSALYLTTVLSVLLLGVMLLLFTFWAPEHYPADALLKDFKFVLIDLIFALVLLVNDVCVFLSLANAVKNLRTSWQASRLRKISDLMLGLYPVILLGALCQFDPLEFVRYLCIPVRILFHV